MGSGPLSARLLDSCLAISDTVCEVGRVRAVSVALVCDVLQHETDLASRLAEVLSQSETILVALGRGVAGR